MAQQGLTARRGAPRGRFGSLPNLLTYGRILAIPALVGCFFVISDWGRWVALAVIVVAVLFVAFAFSYVPAPTPLPSPPLPFLTPSLAA
jgi:hypothetical protein